MASIRRGYSDDFVIKNNKVGIGSSNPQETLDVVGGALQGQDLKVTGVSTQTGYTGFLRSKHEIEENTTLRRSKISDQGGNVSSLSGEIIVGTGITVTIDSVGVGTTVVGVGTETTTNIITPSNITQAGSGQLNSLKVFNTFTPPSGGTNERPAGAKPGQLYYNYDLKTIEFYDGNGWRQVDNTTRSGRAVFGGGNAPTLSPTTRDDIDFVNIQTLGNAQDFGDLTLARNNVTGCSSEIRGIFGQGDTPTYQDRIDYITIASQGNAIDFGNISTTNRSYASGCSSSTRGLFNGGYTPSPSAQTVNVIDRIEISTTGNAVDFGDLFHKVYAAASTSSTTRAIVAGGVGTPDLGTDPSIRYGQIQKYEIGSGGTSIDFGQLSESRWSISGMSDGTRGVFGGGSKPTYLKLMDFVNISSGGNAVQFGDLSETKQGSGQASSKTRGLFHSGMTPSNPQTNRIEYINMTSLGDAIDFGDAATGRSRMGAFSDSHGGLGGF